MAPKRNIGGDPNDLSYRYKMPRLVVKVEGRGNGIKTRLVNVVDVAKALHRDPAYITKYFGCELGAQAKINLKVPEYIVNGAHDVNTFDTLLDVFIQKYVLCGNCHLPETDLSVKKNTILFSCNACPNSGVIDYKHRVDTYIIKNPPKESDRVKVKAKKNVQKREDELAQKAKTLTIKDDNENEEWAIDMSDAAVAERVSQAADGAIKSMIQIEEEEPDTMEGKFKKILNDSSMAPEAKFKAIRSLQKAEKFGNIQRTTLMFESLFSEKMLSELALGAPIVKVFCSDPRTHKTLLVCLEALLEKNPNLVNRICDILQGFYEFELIGEEMLVSWMESPKHKYSDPTFHDKVKVTAKPFMNWLTEDDEEEEEEEEEGEEEEEEEEEKFVPVVVPTTAAARRFLSPTDDDDDSDSDSIDLDAL